MTRPAKHHLTNSLNSGGPLDHPTTIMQPITPGILLQQLNWRYATKKFDSTRQIPEETWTALEQALILTASSFGLQPWKFLVVTGPGIRQQLQAASWGQAQVTECSHHLVLAARTEIQVAQIAEYIQSIAEIRQQATDHPSLQGLRGMLEKFVLAPGFPVRDWAAKQAYIALGNFLTSAALLGVDTCPMEGLDPVKYDEILGLTGSGFTTVVACPAGYRAADDKYAQLAKVRFPAAQLVQHL